MIKKRIRHIITCALQTFTVCIVCLMIHGCNSEFENPGDVSDDTVQVRFRIRLGVDYGTYIHESRSYGTSLPPDYNDSTKYETGTEYENYLDIPDNNFRFLLFDNLGKFVEKMDVLGIYPIGDAKYPSDYTVLCALTKKPDATFRIMVLANWGEDNYPEDADLTVGVTTISDVCEGTGVKNTYVYSSPFTPSAATPIPMYGIKTCTMPTTADRYIDIGDLYLLRALAKVEVVCLENSGLELASVQLTAHNTKGFCAPQKMYDNTDYVTATHIPTDAGYTEEPVDFHISGNKATIYIPEYINTGATTPCRLSVTFTDKTDKHYTVDFCQYDSNGNPTDNRFDILRNVCYRFTVDKMAEFTVDLLPYGVIELDPDFGID